MYKFHFNLNERSILFANAGYLVMEIGYNLPQLGQTSLFLRKDLDLEFFEYAIKKFLSHPKCSGSKVAVLGQSKGADIAPALATLCPEIVELSISQGSYSICPQVCDTTYRDSWKFYLALTKWAVPI